MLPGHGGGFGDNAEHIGLLERQRHVQPTSNVMKPNKVDRSKAKRLTDLPNVGKATANDLRLLGFLSPEQLAGECPFEMYERLCRETGRRHDPCVIDVFMSITQFLKGEPPRPWWEFTKTRKSTIPGGIAK